MSKIELSKSHTMKYAIKLSSFLELKIQDSSCSAGHQLFLSIILDKAIKTNKPIKVTFHQQNESMMQLFNQELDRGTLTHIFEIEFKKIETSSFDILGSRNYIN